MCRMWKQPSRKRNRDHHSRCACRLSEQAVLRTSVAEIRRNFEIAHRRIVDDDVFAVPVHAYAVHVRNGGIRRLFKVVEQKTRRRDFCRIFSQSERLQVSRFKLRRQFFIRRVRVEMPIGIIRKREGRKRGKSLQRDRKNVCRERV